MAGSDRGGLRQFLIVEKIRDEKGEENIGQKIE